MGTELLDQQKAFAEAYVLGHGNATQAAIDAGYSAVSARQTASRLLHTPHVQDAIRKIQVTSLEGRLASKALGVVEKLLDDGKTPPGVRLDAAKTILDRAGLIAKPSVDPDDRGDKPPREMTVSELTALVQIAQRRYDEQLAALIAEEQSAQAIEHQP